jgi:hypothetical protein
MLALVLVCVIAIAALLIPPRQVDGFRRNYEWMKFHKLEAKGMPAGLPEKLWTEYRDKHAIMTAWYSDPNWHWGASDQAQVEIWALQKLPPRPIQMVPQAALAPIIFKLRAANLC